MAILSANYLACRLSEAYPILYRGGNSRVAHECIVDTRIFARHGVTVDDFAKRLIDHGFHAPTMSFPVACFLIVPTGTPWYGIWWCSHHGATAAWPRASVTGGWPICP